MENQQEPIETSILKLNDDCLLEVFLYLTPKKVLKLENVCTTFERVAQMYYKTCATMNMDKYLGEKEILEELSRKTGSYTNNLRATRRTGVFLKARVVIPLLPCYTNLEHLYLEGITGLMNLTEHMTFLFTKLKTVNLIDCELSDEVGAWIHVATKIESLGLARNYIRGSFLSSMKHLSNLKEIDLSSCFNLERRYFLEFCKNHPGLKSLGLMQWEQLNQMCVDTIFNYWKELETLKIGHMMFHETRIKIIFNALADLPKLIHLEFFSCGHLNISDFLLLLANHDQLEHLRISLSASDIALQALTKFTKLKIFDIFCDFPTRPCLDELLKNLQCKQVLEKVVLVTAIVTNKGIYEFIKMCPNLKLINLRLSERISDNLFMLLKPHLANMLNPLKIYVKHTQVSYNVDDYLDLDYRNPKLMIEYETESENEYVHESDDGMEEEEEVEEETENEEGMEN
ncbi:hypothetical protein DMENIID0001_033960 [Sergentomyia squamirostris]